MSGFHADLRALDDLIARLLAFERQAESVTSDVESRVDRLHADWTGRAAAEHLAAHRQWLDGARQMRSAAVELRSVVATAHGNYVDAASANARMWG